MQLALLDSVVEGSLRLGGPTQPTVVLVHLVNPFGFDRGRRFNEHNVRRGPGILSSLTSATIQVDLNRNNLHSAAEWADVLGRAPDFAGYESLRPFLAPGRAGGATARHENGRHAHLAPFCRFPGRRLFGPDHALSAAEVVAHLAKGLLLLADKGFDVLKRAIVTGYASTIPGTDPDALFFRAVRRA